MYGPQNSFVISNVTQSYIKKEIHSFDKRYASFDIRESAHR